MKMTRTMQGRWSPDQQRTTLLSQRVAQHPGNVAGVVACEQIFHPSSFRTAAIAATPESMTPDESQEKWILGLVRSLSSGAHSRDPLGPSRNDEVAN
jgi:hypothetical protein